MDFFACQQRAERHSRHVVWLFVPSVIVTAICVSLPLLYFNVQSFVLGAVGTATIIALGTLYKLEVFSTGGSAVAESVGARRVAPDTRDFRERRLLDIVDELALGASVKVPPVYVLDEEQGINAFAAGFSQQDAVITVTSGALHNLSRDELQAVLGHEMSHIVHSDVKLNLRLAALVAGLLLVVTLGLFISRIASQMSGGSRSSSDNSFAVLAALIVLGLLAAAVGWVGMLIAQMLQASVCRQRELLADASSVQYTRNPGAMCSALAKIQVLETGSALDHHDSMNLAHMLFAEGTGNWWSKMVASHPPIEVRLREIDKNYRIDADSLIADAKRQQAMAQDAHPVAHAAAQQFGQSPIPVFNPALASASSGVVAAQQLLTSLPQSLRQASRDPTMAGALAAGLMLSSDEEIRARQLDALQRADPALHAKTTTLIPALDSAGVHSAVPLANLAGPTLAQLPPAEQAQLQAPLNAVANAGGGPHALAQSIYGLLQARVSSGVVPWAPKYVALAPVMEDVAIVLWALASTVGSSSDGVQSDAQAAFDRGAARLPVATVPMPVEAPPQRFVSAIGRIDESSGPVKARVMDALSACIYGDATPPSADAIATFRAIAASLHCSVQ
jgi:Zn-dependent protease with chaperone function